MTTSRKNKFRVIVTFERNLLTTAIDVLPLLSRAKECENRFIGLYYDKKNDVLVVVSEDYTNHCNNNYLYIASGSFPSCAQAEKNLGFALKRKMKI